ncbi:DUF6157 family protein [Streptococcus suis]|uniref:DUF6157 family protein n=1 Tax=Streptococcus parasuis TaxID=1501662 RepID=UPI002379351C|nr:DUF6157 family protein [Streptococcus parasuis]WDN58618.1 DUF6157 family protein [Streptococcus parasuis]WDN60468.1 DUF6157 family protein [Streptococcus parasuis]
MKKHSTNYYNAFLAVAEDCPVEIAQEPPLKEPKSAVRIQYDRLKDSPYQYTSDQVIYESNGARRGISEEEFFSKGQACMRSSAQDLIKSKLQKNHLNQYFHFEYMYLKWKVLISKIVKPVS